MDNFWNDLVYAARLLRKSPGFTIMAVLVLTIGIGATSAMFSLLDAVLLRPLPFHHPDELMVLWEKPPGYDRNSVAPLNFLDWSEQNQVFTGMGDRGRRADSFAARRQSRTDSGPGGDDILVTFVSTPLILAGVVLLACAVPALRASRVHPAVALRQE